MNLIYRKTQSFGIRLERWANRKQLGRVDERIFRHGDCLATVQALGKYHRARRLCDIGANKGQWSYVFRELNPQLEAVVMFEPQSRFVQELENLALPGVSKHVFPFALGEQDEQLSITGGTASASLLEASEYQHQYFPGSVTRESEMIEVRRLDEVYRSNGLAYPDLIKIDVQGYELNALKGALEVLAQARYLVVELSLREFYQGQPPLWELWRFLDEQQYVMVDHGHELRSRTPPHELLQFDAIFANRRFI